MEHEGEVVELAVDVGVLGPPDVGTVDVLARVQLAARHAGCRVRVTGVTDELRGMLALTGLLDALCRPPYGLVLEDVGQPEDREERAAEEVRDVGDPPA